MKDIDSISPVQNQDPKAANRFGLPRQAAAQPTQKNSVNLLKNPGQHRGKKILKRILWIVAAIIVILSATLVMRAANLSNKIFVGQKTTFFGQIVNFFNGGAAKNLLAKIWGK